MKGGGIFIGPEIPPSEVRMTSAAEPLFGISCEPSHMTDIDPPTSVRQHETKAPLADQFNGEAHKESCVPSAPPDGDEYLSQDSPEPPDGSEYQYQDPSNTPQRYVCLFCNRIFDWRTTLKSHQSYHTSDRPFLCPHPNCTESFSQNNDRDTHEKTHCKEGDLQCGEPLPDDSSWSESISDTCSLLEMLRIPSPTAGVSPSTIAERDQSTAYPAGQTSAEASPTTGVSPEAVDGGERTPKTRHTPKRSVTCSLCSKVFTRRTGLNTHHRRKHTRERPFRCAICGETFAHDSDKKRHAGTHGGKKAFECGGTRSDGSHWGCGKAYRRKDGLLEHHNKSFQGGKCVAERDKS